MLVLLPWREIICFFFSATLSCISYCSWWGLVEKSWGALRNNPKALPFYSNFDQVIQILLPICHFTLKFIFIFYVSVWSCYTNNTFGILCLTSISFFVTFRGVVIIFLSMDSKYQILLGATCQTKDFRHVWTWKSLFPCVGTMIYDIACLMNYGPFMHVHCIIFCDFWRISMK